ncbi:MAG: ComEC/Rec2 family competence protein [Mariniblastus sp.]|nr:ComEC/Rec2 family competence protein [Mariniblastus sp.]
MRLPPWIGSMIPSSRNRSTRISYSPILWVVVAWCGGILFDRTIDVSFVISLTVSLSAWVLWCWLFLRFKRHGRAERIAALVLLMSIAGLGASWHHGRWNWFPARDISQFASEIPTPVCLRAEIRSEPRPMACTEGSLLNPIPSRSRTLLKIKPQQIRNGSVWESVSGRSELMIHDRCRHLRVGDQVLIFGTLVRISPPSNPGQFDFHESSRGESRLAIVHAYFSDSVRVESSVNRAVPGWLLSTLRRQFNDLVWEYVGPDRAPLASAILLGNREQLSATRREEFVQTGTVHLLAISGLHVGILAGTFFLLFRVGFASRHWALWLTLVFVLVYAWLVEFRPPVTRASILLVLLCLGRLYGKRGFGFNLLALAALVVLVMNPADLFQVGPQLSFLAVAGIILFRDWIFRPPSDDPLERLIRTTRCWPTRCLQRLTWRVRQVVLVSSLIWLLALPLVACRFHLVSPIAPLLNPLLLIPISLALYTGMGLFLFGGWLKPVADCLGMACTFALSGLESAIQVCQRLPFSHFWTVGPSALATLAFYLGFFALCIGLPRSKQKVWLPLCGLAWLVWAWLVPAAIHSHWQRSDRQAELVCTFVDVGHGTSVLIQTPGGTNLLYDAGTLGSPRFGLNNVSGLLWSEQVRHVDALFVSHADLDHFNVIPDLCRRFSIGVVYLTPPMNDSSSLSVQLLLDRLQEQNIEVHELSWKTEFQWGGHTRGTVLSPPPEGTGSTDNSDSIVLLIEAYGRKFLLPGDLEGVGMDLLLSRPPVDCDVVMAPHHGSPNSRPDDFLEWSRPEYVLVSASPKKVANQTMEILGRNGRTVHRTGAPGAVRYRVEPSGNLIQETYRAGKWQTD